MNETAATSNGAGRGRVEVRHAVTRALVRLLLAITLTGCATVAPQDRAMLADPTMQFDAESKHEAALRHAIENREGSTGGTGVSGGGCGCN
jgi:Domain of unknown function (DUF4266)